MRRQEFSGSEARKLKLKGRPQRPDFPQTTFVMQRVFWQSGQEGSCGPGSVKPGLAWPAAASTTSHRPGSGWEEEEGWQEGQEQLSKGRVREEGDAAGWQDT